MSNRIGQAQVRNLSLTEELERLEQSITLTLQEIDHNFSKAHRIVTSSILPVVEQYAQHSRDAWEGTKFWKQFFEASANVSLSGYEEEANDMTQTDTATSHDSTFQTPSHDDDQDDSAENGDDNTVTGASYDDEEETSIIDSPSNTTGVHSTPLLPRSTTKSTKSKTRPTAAAAAAASSPSSAAPRSRVFKSLPPKRPTHAHDDEVSTPIRHNYDLTSSSPFEPPSAFQPATAQRQNPDPILHRVLDRNYRIQATPLTTRKSGRSAGGVGPASETPATDYKTQTRTFLPDSSPMSSPELAAPQLRSDLFSPEKRSRASATTTPLTPGVSVQTPAKNATISTGRALFTNPSNNPTNTNLTNNNARNNLWDSDSDSDDALGISPPKTMQFHVPQSRLLQTPAREASKRIVEDLLATAGADRTDELEDEGDVPDISPSMVRRSWDDDDTF